MTPRRAFLAAATLALVVTGTAAPAELAAGDSGLAAPREVRDAVPVDKGERFGRISPAPNGMRTAASTPLQVRLHAGAVPQLNEPVRVRLELHAFADAPDTDVALRLPAGGEVLAGRTRDVFDLTEGETVSLEATIRLTQPGEQAITASARRVVRLGEIWADADQLYLTVGARSTRLGYASAEDNGTRATLSPAVRTEARWPSPVLERPSAPGSAPLTATAPAFLVTLSICVAFYDRIGTEWLRDAQIEVWDADVGTADLLNIGLSGYFDGCRTVTVDNVDVDEGGAIDPYFVIWLFNSARYEVRTYAGNTYYCYTNSVPNVGGNYSFGTVTCGTPAAAGRAYSVHNDMYRERRFIQEAALNFGFGHDPGKCTVLWQDGGNDGNYYRPSDGLVRLNVGGGNSRDVVSHECAHRYMHVLYASTGPPSDCPSPHIVQSVSGKYCAWDEGWTYVLTSATDGNPVYTFSNGGLLDLETPNCASSGWDDGARVEGRVGGALIDLLDPFGLSFGSVSGFANEGVASACSADDPVGGYFPNIWNVLSIQNDNVFSPLDGDNDAFSAAWQAVGYSTDAFRRVSSLNSIGTTGPPVTPPPVAPPPPPACIVPRVVGLTLPRARTAIRSRRCTVGRVRRARSRVRRGRVISQSRAARRRLPAGTRVHLVVSRGRR